MTMLEINPKVNDIVLIATEKKEYKSDSGKYGIVKDIDLLNITGKVTVMLEESTETMGSLSHTFFLEDLILVRREGIITPFEWNTLKQIVHLLPEGLKEGGMDKYSAEVVSIALKEIARNMKDIEEGFPFTKIFPRHFENNKGK